MPKDNPISNLFQLRKAQVKNPNKIKIKKAPRMSFPIGIENKYKKYLLTYVNLMYKMFLFRRDTIKQLLTNFNESRKDAKDIKKDFIEDDIVEFYNSQQRSFLDRISESDLKFFVADIALLLSIFQKKQLDKVITGMIGVTPLITEKNVFDLLALFNVENVRLIRTIDSRFFAEIEEATFRAFREGQRWETLRNTIQKRYKIARNRATLIATDQIEKLNGQLNQIRQTSLGIEEYIWRTMRDSRVRPLHRAREGKKFRWSKPPSDGHPGQPVRCRCFAEPILDNLI